MLIRNMMVMIWSKKRQNEKEADDLLANTLANEDIPADFNIISQNCDYNDDDYDPFGNGFCDADGEDMAAIVEPVIPPAILPGYITPDIQARYPGYVRSMPL